MGDHRRIGVSCTKPYIFRYTPCTRHDLNLRGMVTVGPCPWTQWTMGHGSPLPPMTSHICWTESRSVVLVVVGPCCQHVVCVAWCWLLMSWCFASTCTTWTGGTCPLPSYLLPPVLRSVTVIEIGRVAHVPKHRAIANGENDRTCPARKGSCLASRQKDVVGPVIAPLSALTNSSE